jgi:hypothetical protein
MTRYRLQGVELFGNMVPIGDQWSETRDQKVSDQRAASSDLRVQPPASSVQNLRVPSPVPKQQVGGFGMGVQEAVARGTLITLESRQPELAAALASQGHRCSCLHGNAGACGMRARGSRYSSHDGLTEVPRPLAQWGQGTSISHTQHLYSGGIQPRVDHPAGGRMIRDGLASHIGVRWHTKHVLSDPFF